MRVWGSQTQLTPPDGSLTTLHEAWGQLLFSDHFSAKLGRQEIIYDVHRMFGNVRWLQQARSHDALLLKFEDNGLKVDVGLAFNQDGVQSTTSFYTVANSYKTFQYLWGHKDFQDLMATLNSTTDPDARTKLLQQAQTTISEDYVNGYLFQLAALSVAKAGVQGLWVNAPTQATDRTGGSWAN